MYVAAEITACHFSALAHNKASTGAPSIRLHCMNTLRQEETSEIKVKIFPSFSLSVLWKLRNLQHCVCVCLCVFWLVDHSTEVVCNPYCCWNATAVIREDLCAVPRDGVRMPACLCMCICVCTCVSVINTLHWGTESQCQNASMFMSRCQM